jgi:predicted DNA-binding transcriptional regulator AlpA
MHPHEYAAQRDRLNVEQAAAYIGVSESVLNKARLTGDGPVFLKLGRLVAYDRAELDTWLASRRRASKSATSAPVTAHA